jgi:hypothetical protein
LRHEVQAAEDARLAQDAANRERRLSELSEYRSKIQADAREKQALVSEAKRILAKVEKEAESAARLVVSCDRQLDGLRRGPAKSRADLDAEVAANVKRIEAMAAESRHVGPVISRSAEGYF